MASKDHHYTNLFNRLLEGELSPQDTEEIIAWLGKEELDTDAKELIISQLKEFVPEKISPQVISALEAKLPAIFRLASEHAVESYVRQPISGELGSGDRTDTVRPVRRIRFLKTAWLKYAAAVLIIFGAAAYFWNTLRDDRETATTNDNRSFQTDIPPGGDKAILTLADGSKIILDSAADGMLANQGGVQVVKLANGQIVYDMRGFASSEVFWNTISTPVGGQYQITLPDGTRVWLNAASSITFPTAFTGEKRSVKISGEIYFEVARNPQKPFVADVDGKSVVEVLGTSFNINSYTDEGSIKTTLFEGSVKVNRVADDQPKGAVILKPGQQAIVVSTDRQQNDAAGIQVNSNADLDQTLAWKNGLFNFNGLDLPVVMRQLERWYDIKVKYEGKVPSLIFRGEMYRSANLSDALDIFQKLGVKFRMEGRTVIISEI